MASRKDAYRDALADLLPLGEAWEAKDIPDKNLYKLLFTFAELFNEWHCTMDELVLEFFTATTTILKDNWENELYGPDLTECVKNLPLPLQQQVRAIVAKSFAIGGNRIEYYQDIACIFGFDLNVTENFPTQFEVKFELFLKDGDCDLFTLPIKGSSQRVILGTTPQSLSELGIVLDPDAGKVTLSFDGNINDYKLVARYKEDGVDPTALLGQRAHTYQTYEFTREQAINLNLISPEGVVGINITQYERGFQQQKFRTFCESFCERIAKSDFDNDIQAFRCVMQSIMPAHLIFNIFVDGKLYDIITP